MRTVLVLSGGGIWGVMPADCLAEIEAYVKKPLYQVFDMIVGTSTGAILGAELAAGVPASICRNLYAKKGKALFSPRSKINPFNWFREKYDRKPILDEISRSLAHDSELKNPSPSLSQLKTKFMCTSVSIVDERTHYFKGWEQRDGQIPVLTAVARSFAAAYYFGAINDPENKQVWVDGGEGSDNLPLIDAYLEAMNQDWLKEGVYFLAFGCGSPKPGIPYTEASKMGWVGESKFYLNLARRQSAREQEYEVNALARGRNIALDYVDFIIPREWDELDNVGRINDALRIAMAQFPPYLPQILTRIKNAKQIL